LRVDLLFRVVDFDFLRVLVPLNLRIFAPQALASLLPFLNSH